MLGYPRLIAKVRHTFRMDRKISPSWFNAQNLTRIFRFQQLKAKYGEPLNKLHGELCVQLGAIRGQGNLEQERALNKLKGHAELATAVLQAVERNDANAMQRMAAKGLGSFEQCLVNLLNHWQQMKARVAAGDPAENVGLLLKSRSYSSLLSVGRSVFSSCVSLLIWSARADCYP